MTAPDRFAEAWRSNRPYLVDLAFRMLGDVGEAEDVVQEAFTRLARTDSDIQDERGWLTVVTGRLCLDQLRSARTRRERPHDASVIETLADAPSVDPADRITLDDNVRMALFVVLERLSPAERVTFVLHDVFQVPFETIAEILGRPVPTCRQLARRARHKIASDPSRPHNVAPSEHRLVTEKFIAACADGDIDALLAVLHPQVWGMAEFVAGSAIAPQTNHGPELVAHNLMRYYGPGVTLVSHPPALLAFLDRGLFAVLTLTIDNGLITTLHATVNPGQP